jgi:hypothetical protein
MSTDNCTDRRAFLATALATLASRPTATPAAVQAPEVPNYRADVPAGATLWGLAVFTADHPVEITVAAGKAVKSIRGRFGGERLTQYSWRNTSSNKQQVVIRAKAMAGDRGLPPTLVQFISGQNVYVGFGRRGTPLDKAEDRIGGYPFEAVFVGFIVFED